MKNKTYLIALKGQFVNATIPVWKDGEFTKQTMIMPCNTQVNRGNLTLGTAVVENEEKAIEAYAKSMGYAEGMLVAYRLKD